MNFEKLSDLKVAKAASKKFENKNYMKKKVKILESFHPDIITIED